MNTVVRFTHGGGNTDFYADEVPKLEKNVIQDVDLYQDVNGYWHLYRMSPQYSRVRIWFNLARSTTIERIEDLFDRVDSYKQPEEMTLYYRYGIDTTTYPLRVKMIRDQMRWPYITGYQAAEEVLKFDFYATTMVTVHRKRVSV